MQHRCTQAAILRCANKQIGWEFISAEENKHLKQYCFIIKLQVQRNIARVYNYVSLCLCASFFLLYWGKFSLIYMAQVQQKSLAYRGKR